MTSLPSSGRAALAGILAFALQAGGCSSLLPGKAPPPDLYKLPTAAAPAAAEAGVKPLALQLVVDTPLAARALDTDRIAVRSDTYALAYLAGARWDDSAPRVVQARLIEAFEQAHVAAGVGRAEDGIRGDLGLVSELRAFEVVAGGLSAPVIHVEIATKLVSRPLGDVKASRVFSAQIKASSRRSRDVVAAFDQALSTISGDAVTWIRTVGGSS